MKQKIRRRLQNMTVILLIAFGMFAPHDRHGQYPGRRLGQPLAHLGRGSRGHLRLHPGGSLHLGDVGRHLQHGRRGSWQVHRHRLGRLHDDGLRLCRHGRHSGLDRRPHGFVPHQLLRAAGLRRLYPLLRPRGFEERQ